jgi:molybdenum cofactor biosynthesis protein B
MSRDEHRARAPRSVGCAVLTVSDTRTAGTDESGRLTRERLEAAGHRVVGSAIVRDEPEAVIRELTSFLKHPDVEAILVNGGTGISPRDRTHDAVASLLETRLDGFGEIFRALSFQEIGPAAMLSRAIAGLSKGRVLFSMPGSPAAVGLALDRLIIPELAHIVGESRKT